MAEPPPGHLCRALGLERFPVIWKHFQAPSWPGLSCPGHPNCYGAAPSTHCCGVVPRDSKVAGTSPAMTALAVSPREGLSETHHGPLPDAAVADGFRFWSKHLPRSAAACIMRVCGYGRRPACRSPPPPSSRRRRTARNCSASPHARRRPRSHWRPPA